jgi:hypothetical protein
MRRRLTLRAKDGLNSAFVKSRANRRFCYAGFAMPKARKATATVEPPSIPQIGDKVIPEGSDSAWVVTQVSPSGDEVSLGFEGTNLDRFRVRTDTTKFVDRAPRTSKPVADANPR